VNTRVVFFFQAEDGIRARNVTGVQTCALPIWPCSACAPGNSPGARCERGVAPYPHRDAVRIIGHFSIKTFDMQLVRGLHNLRPRSEERRVGKECRSRETQVMSK